MAAKSLELVIPDTPPYDRPDSWFESFVGSHLLPVIQAAPLGRFWFTRYGGVGAKKWILFRFECDDPAGVQPYIDRLVGAFSPGDSGYCDYDAASDIGEGEGSRFLGANGRHHDKRRRGDLAFDFLHATAKLFLDGLAGPDAGGYFVREPETASGFSRETCLEQFHHLFCNMTGVPSFVAEAEHPDHGNHLLSLITFATLKNGDARWNLKRLAKINF
jgi:hypothetical protein